MKLRIFKAVVPSRFVREAARELAERQLVDCYSVEGERLHKLEAHVWSSRVRTYIVDLLDAETGKHAFTVAVSSGRVNEYARVLRDVNTEPAVKPPVGARVLRLAALLLPGVERANWLAEQWGYLADLPTHRARQGWIFAQLRAMPRYAYTVRTGREKRSA